jgi:very-short-patch-repair endonuclease
VYRRVLPDVYAAKRELSLSDRIAAAWLWSRRQGVVTGVAASALWDAHWVDGSVPIELNLANNKSPAGVLTRNETLLDTEVARVRGMLVTTAERTAFDLARRGSVAQAVERLDALAGATHFKAVDVRRLADRHPHVKGRRRVAAVLELVDEGAQSPREYDGEHHRIDRPSYTNDIVRLEYINSVGWIVVRVVADNRRDEVVWRVRRAWAARKAVT